MVSRASSKEWTPRASKPSNPETKFGPYGGRFVPEILIPPLVELETAWTKVGRDRQFLRELEELRCEFGGRPTPLYRARRLSDAVGHTVYLKREDLLHTGSHKLNNALGQALLAKRMGKERLIAETGPGQHGLAVATAGALLGLECTVYMGATDMRRQRNNIESMHLLGATVIEVDAGASTVKEAISEAIRDWAIDADRAHYLIGSAIGPAPYPALVRDLQRVIGDEARLQMLDREGRLPDRAIACIGGGSNSIGLFSAFLADEDVGLVGVEAGGEGLDTQRHGAPLSTAARAGVLHGTLSAVMQNEDGQILDAHSISAGLDYPGAGPQHAWLRDSGRATYEAVGDDAAVEAFSTLATLEGIIPALESAHAIAWALANTDADLDLICLSGRGDKDLVEVAERL